MSDPITNQEATLHEYNRISIIILAFMLVFFFGLAKGNDTRGIHD